MIDNHYYPEMFVLGDTKFEIGDLVVTILNEYGVIVGFGKHLKYDADESEYCYVLIGDKVCYYLPFALIKVNKKDKKT